MLEYLILGIIFIILGYASFYDYKKLLVQNWTVSLILVFGVLYVIATNNIINSIGVLVFTIFIWGLPVFFGFGLGDTLLLLGLSLFLGSLTNMWNFYFILIIVWTIWTITMIYKYYYEHKIKRLKDIFRHEYPLVPVIAISFYLWFLLSYILPSL